MKLISLFETTRASSCFILELELLKVVQTYNLPHLILARQVWPGLQVFFIIDVTPVDDEISVDNSPVDQILAQFIFRYQTDHQSRDLDNNGGKFSAL